MRDERTVRSHSAALRVDIFGVTSLPQAESPQAEWDTAQPTMRSDVCVGPLSGLNVISRLQVFILHLCSVAQHVLSRSYTDL